MSDASPGNPAEHEHRPLPRREPRPLLVHALVDAAVAFLALIVVLLILDVSFVAVIVAAVVLGAAAAPFTRRAEERALEARPAPEE